MFQQAFNTQWDSLKAELQNKLRQTAVGDYEESLNSWYSEKCYRYRGIGSLEQLQLKNTGNDVFCEAFLKTLEAFRFAMPQEKEQTKKITPKLKLIGAAVISLALFGVCACFISILISLLIALFLFAVLFVIILMLSEKRMQTAQAQREESILNQFEAQRQKLLAVCQEFEIE